MATPAQIKAKNKYEKVNIRLIKVRLNRKTEPELIKWVESKDSMQGYIIDLIRADIKKHQL